MAGSSRAEGERSARCDCSPRAVRQGRSAGSATVSALLREVLPVVQCRVVRSAKRLARWERRPVAIYVTWRRSGIQSRFGMDRGRGRGRPDCRISFCGTRAGNAAAVPVLPENARLSAQASPGDEPSSPAWTGQGGLQLTYENDRSAR